MSAQMMLWEENHDMGDEPVYEGPAADVMQSELWRFPGIYSGFIEDYDVDDDKGDCPRVTVTVTVWRRL